MADNKSLLTEGRPFKIEVPDEVLADLAERLAKTRLPQVESGGDWSRGMPLAYARQMLDHWRERFDWREQERRLNRYSQRLITVAGQDIHVLIEVGSGQNPLPLLLLNGWPSSFVEFDQVIDRLAHPEQHGGRIEDAFTVIIPAMPGYGFSPPPPAPMEPACIAALWSELMAKLGIDRYVVFGSDWGTLIARHLAELEAPGLHAIMITTAGGFIPPDPAVTPCEEEAQWLARIAAPNPESAYQVIQASKPDAMAFAQTDSPLVLASWIVEKFRAWTTPADDGGPPFALDDLLANVMFYWLNGPAAPMWLYGYLSQSVIRPGLRIPVPAGFLLCADDLMAPVPRSVLERAYDVRYYAVHATGGHFLAQEAPHIFVAELTAFFRPFREG